MKYGLKLPILVPLILMILASNAIAEEVYGPTPPVGYMERLGQSVANWWSSVKDRVAATLPKAPIPTPEKATAGADSKGKETEQTTFTMPNLKSVQTVTDSVERAQALSLKTTSAPVNLPGAEPFIPKQTKALIEAVALPRGAAPSVRQRVSFSLPTEQDLEVKLPKDYLAQNLKLLEFNPASLEKPDHLPRDQMALLMSLVQWLFMPAEKNDAVVGALFGLGRKSDDLVIREKSMAFTGWILAEKAMPGLAALAFAQGLNEPKKAASSPEYDNAILSALSDLARKTPLAKELVTSSAIERLSTLKSLEPEALGYLNLIQAERAFDKKAFGAARKLAQAVPSKTDWKEQARYLASSALFAQGESKEHYETVGHELTELFRTVEDPTVFDVTAVTLGRVHFLLGNYKAAHQYLSQVTKETNLFIEAAVDNAWALLRSGDRNHAVGNMFTLHTPYFDGAYMPESYFIKSLGYQEICQFGDAMTAVKGYKQRYAESFKKLSEFNAASKTIETAYYDDLAAYLKGKDHKIPGIILRELGRHPEFLKRQGMLNALSKDERAASERLPASAPALTTWLSDKTASLKENHKKAIHSFMKRRALAVEDELKFLTANISLLEYEIFAGAGQNLALQGAQNFAVDEKNKNKREYEDGKEYWPYEEEIWEDELNNFRSKIVDGCARVKQAQS